MKKQIILSLLVVMGLSFQSIDLLANANKVTPQETGPDSDNANTTTYAASEGPYLMVRSPNHSRKFSRSELLGSPYLKKLIIEKDPSYKNKKRNYSVIPVAQLFGEFQIAENTTIAFNCLDGFSAPISAARLLNTNPNQAIAYLAIELPGDNWPVLKARDGKSAGPYYLVWENPEKSHISIEEWPFQLAGFEIKGTLAEQFPHTVPDASIKDNQPIMKGYKSFMKNCFGCHTLNNEGLTHMGPDLNIPFNPTEYLKLEFMELLIRKPSSLRKWNESKMSAFAKDNLPDEELKSIILYLQYMTKHKVKI